MFARLASSVDPDMFEYIQQRDTLLEAAALVVVFCLVALLVVNV